MLNADPTVPTAGAVTSSIRRNALDTDAVLHRAKEEKEMLPLEMANFLEDLNLQHNELLDLLSRCDCTNRLGIGTISLTILRLAALEKKSIP